MTTEDNFTSTVDGAAGHARMLALDDYSWCDGYEQDEPDLPERDGEADCPECDEGVVMPVGRMEHDTGHQPYCCSARCGYSG